MKELKTLKDLKFIDERYLTGKTKINYDKFISQKEIKAEAIKWAKIAKSPKQPMELRIFDYESILEFIKHFFNLTEEDLR